MNSFFWTSGHLGWGIFALVVFTCLWCLLGDLYWRFHTIKIHHFLLALASGWALGAGLILINSYIGS